MKLHTLLIKMHTAFQRNGPKFRSAAFRYSQHWNAIKKGGLWRKCYEYISMKTYNMIYMAPNSYDVG